MQIQGIKGWHDPKVRAELVPSADVYEKYVRMRNVGDRNVKMDGQKLRRAVIMARQGESWRDIAVAVGVDRTTIKGWVEFLPLELGLTPPRRPTPKPKPPPLKPTTKALPMSFTFADNKLGGRVTACCDAIAAGHLNRAAGIFAELADELNVEATEAALLSEDTPIIAQPEPAAPQLATAQPAMGTAMDLQMCSRNVHSFGAPDSNGWRTCAVCGSVNVAPPDNNGPIDMSARQ